MNHKKELLRGLWVKPTASHVFPSGTSHARRTRRELKNLQFQMQARDIGAFTNTYIISVVP